MDQVELQEGLHCFFDWKAGLEKQVAGQAVYIYCLKKGLGIAKLLGDDEAAAGSRFPMPVRSTATAMHGAVHRFICFGSIANKNLEDDKSG